MNIFRKIVAVVFTLAVMLGAAGARPAHASTFPLNVTAYVDVYDTVYNNTMANYFLGYFSDLNYILAKNTTDQLFATWTGGPTAQLLVSPTVEPWNESTTNCNYNNPNPIVIIWFTRTPPTGYENDIAWSDGVDCDGNFTIALNTSKSNFTNYLLQNPATKIEGDTTNLVYWNIIEIILHEMNHAMGAFRSEGYSWQYRADSFATQYPPSATINWSNPSDAWWTGSYGNYGVNGNFSHPGLLNDPAAQPAMSNLSSTNRANMRLSDFTARFYVPPFSFRQNNTGGTGVDLSASFTNLAVNVWDVNSQLWPTPITVREFLVGGDLDYPDFYVAPSLIGTYTTDPGGNHVNIPWPTAFPAPSKDTNGGDGIVLKFYDAAGNSFGRPEIIDIYNLESYAMQNGVGHVSYPIVYLGKEGATHLLTFDSTTTGWAKESRSGSGVGGSVQTNSILLGDDSSNKGMRSIISIDTSALPDNATVDSFTLTFHVSSISGSVAGWGAPSTPNDFTLGIGNPFYATSALVKTDYQQADYLTLGNVNSSGGYVVGNSYSFTQTVGPATVAINKTGLTQFKIYWTRVTDSDGVADQLGINTVLTDIVYHLP